MTPEQYQEMLDTQQPFIEFQGELIQMPFYISPKLKEYPFDILSNLGELPIKITEKQNEFQENILEVLYPGGKVSYVQNHNILLPEMVRIFGATTEPGIQSLNTKRLDTLLFFDSVNELEIDRNGEYLHYGDIHLQVERLDGDKGILKEWWLTERKG